jgi:hypothetical protein
MSKLIKKLSNLLIDAGFIYRAVMEFGFDFLNDAISTAPSL